MKPLRGDWEIQLRIMLHETIAWRLGISTRLQLDFAPRALKYNKQKWHKTISMIKILFSMWSHFLINKYFCAMHNYFPFERKQKSRLVKSSNISNLTNLQIFKVARIEDGCSTVARSVEDGWRRLKTVARSSVARSSSLHNKSFSFWNPLDTGRKLNVHETFNLQPMSRG